MKKGRKKKIIEKPYEATLKIYGKYFHGNGDTVSEAVQAIQPGVAKGVSILSIAHGESKREKILPPSHTFRIFNGSPFSREVALKQISILFDNL